MAVESLPLYPTLGLGSHFLPVAAPSVPFPFDSLPYLNFFATPSGSEHSEFGVPFSVSLIRP